MPSCRTDRARIVGVVSAVPDAIADVAALEAEFGRDAVAEIQQNTGVTQRYVAPPEMCTSDLCAAAATALLKELSWAPESIEALVFVSQTPDYIIPATACALHGRLGLGPSCAAFDVNLGCSGYVYGLWLACQMAQAGGARRILLLVGDTAFRTNSPQDRATAFLFGDAGSATAIETADGAAPIFFEVGSDGSRHQTLIIPAGGFRKPSTEKTRLRSERGSHNIRSDEDAFMDGGEIFTFTLRSVPPQIKSVLDKAGWTNENVDSFVLHQANRFMLQHLAKKMKLPAEKLPLSLGSYGNTSCASIPITLSASLAGRLRNERLRLVLSGFGVGLSTATVALECGPIVAPPPLKVPVSSIAQ